MYAFCMLPVIMRNRARHYEEQCPELWGKMPQGVGQKYPTPWGKLGNALGEVPWRHMCDFS